MKRKYVCNVCGRTFPEGQGILLEIHGNKLYFHSKACAYKFLREVVLESDSNCIDSSVKKIKKKFDEIIELIGKKAEKKI